MAQAVLINLFEVPVASDDEFLTRWAEAKRFLERQPGYVSTALHRSLDPATPFRFVNVAVWETPEAFLAAVNHPEFEALRKAAPFAYYPALYTVVQQ